MEKSVHKLQSRANDWNPAFIDCKVVQCMKIGSGNHAQKTEIKIVHENRKKNKKFWTSGCGMGAGWSKTFKEKGKMYDNCKRHCHCRKFYCSAVSSLNRERTEMMETTNSVTVSAIIRIAFII